MAKKTKNVEQPEAAVVSSDESKKVGGEATEKKEEATNKKLPPLFIETTNGKRVDRISVYQKNGTMVKAEYGSLSNGKNANEVRKNMKPIHSRALTPEQSAEYQRLVALDPSKRSALEYAARAAFPMHIDDAKFSKADGVINGKEVNYIIIKKMTEKDVTEDTKNLIGKWKVTAGMRQGGPGAHMTTVLDPVKNHEDAELVASFHHRAETKLNHDSSKSVASIGKPMTMMELATAAIMAKQNRLAHESELIEKAKSIDLSKYKLPEGVTITKAYTRPVKDNPDRVWLNGEVNGIRVSAPLSVNETTLVTKMKAPLDIMFVVNKDLAKEVDNIVGRGQEQSAGMHR